MIRIPTSTKTSTLPINDIILTFRQRPVDCESKSYLDLVDSISKLGLIQPIVVNQDLMLIAGNHRLTACKQLGHSHIPVVFLETLNDAQREEMELAENVIRTEMTWQHRCIAIARIHELKKKQSALEGDRWGLRETGSLIGLAASRIQYAIQIANKLKVGMGADGKLDSGNRYNLCENFSNALRLLQRDQEEEIQAELTRRLITQAARETPQSIIDDAVIAPTTQAQDITGLTLDDILKDTGGEDTTSPIPTPPQTTRLDINIPVNLTGRLHHGDCIEWMTSGRHVDHIITDSPYGIDMSNLSQQNTGMADIDTVAKEHDVDENLSLMVKFFPAAFQCVRDRGFVVVWCDMFHWRYLYDLATAAGFKVQRWPLTWVKTHRCMNQAAQYNFTKTTEVALVCRKDGGTLMTPAGECHIIAPHDEYKDTLGHPFVKPYDLWKWIIHHCTYNGQSILDPFAGRGSCIISTIRMQRQFFGIELNDAHYNALVENVRAHYTKVAPGVKFC